MKGNKKILRNVLLLVMGVSLTISPLTNVNAEEETVSTDEIVEQNTNDEMPADSDENITKAEDEVVSGGLLTVPPTISVAKSSDIKIATSNSYLTNSNEEVKYTITYKFGLNNYNGNLKIKVVDVN